MDKCPECGSPQYQLLCYPDFPNETTKEVKCRLCRHRWILPLTEKELIDRKETKEAIDEMFAHLKPST